MSLKKAISFLSIVSSYSGEPNLFRSEIILYNVESIASFSEQDVGNWQQCGGINWRGGTQCDPGYYCYQQNQWYSQCQPSVGSGIVPSNTVTPKLTNPTQLNMLAFCLGTSISSQLYSPLNPGSGYTSYDWLRTSLFCDHVTFLMVLLCEKCWGSNNRIDRYPAAVLMIKNISTVSLAGEHSWNCNPI